MYFNIELSSNNQFFVRLVASNGRILMTSETFKKRGNAFNNIRSTCKGLGSSKKIKVVDYSPKSRVNTFFIENGKITK